MKCNYSKVILNQIDEIVNQLSSDNIPKIDSFDPKCFDILEEKGWIKTIRVDQADKVISVNQSPIFNTLLKRGTFSQQYG